MLDEMKDLGFSWATKAGISLGVEDMCVPEKKAEVCDGTKLRALDAEDRYGNGDITVVERFQKVTDEWAKASEEVKNEAIQHFKENDPTNSVYMMSASGARGNVSQVRQLLAMRGLMADANGQLIEVPITHCLREGMTVTDMLISGNGARKGIIDTALRTADSGYLYRRLDFSGCNTVVLAHDCGTPESIPMHLRGRGAPFDQRIRGRVLGADVEHPETGDILYRKGDLLTDSAAEHVAKVWSMCEKAGLELPPVHVRSALTCNLQEGMCAMCCGEDLSKPGVPAALGYPAGTIAAQSMGEPGTQLTMRTFHTGGAFEGSAGEGVTAKAYGVLSLIAANGEAITPSMAGGAAVVGKWARTRHGDVACLLAVEASLEVRGKDGQVLQKETLPVGTLVHVHHGQEVSLGQLLFAIGAKVDDTVDESSATKIPKPVTSSDDGEVVILEADVDGGRLPENARLVWVLKSARASAPAATGLSVGVQAGDFVATGTPLAVQWSALREHGIPRCLPTPAGMRVDGLRHPVLRITDWGQDPLAVGQAELEGEAPNEKLHIARTDFDCFHVPGHTAEYRVGCGSPVCDVQHLDSSDQKAKVLTGAVSSSVHAYVQNGAWDGDLGIPRVGVITASLKGRASLLCPTGQQAHPEHVVPSGGLVFHYGEGSERGLLWSAEEVHHVRADPTVCADLRRARHGMLHHSGVEVTTEAGPVLRTRSTGCFCMYVRCASPLQPVVVQEEGGILRREAWDRMSSSAAPASGVAECVVKPGVVVTLPSDSFDDTWYSDPTSASAKGVHLHEKLIPKGVPFLAKYPDLRNGAQWQVVELLDDPRTSPRCRVLIRPARWIPFPADAPHPTPAETRSLSSWCALFSHGERFESSSPTALVSKIVSSLSRHAVEPHCVSVTYDRPDTAPSRISAARPLAPLSSHYIAHTAISVTLARPWQSGKLAVTQHTPLRYVRLVRSGPGASVWGEGALKHQLPARRVPEDGASAPGTKIFQMTSTSPAYACKVAGPSPHSSDVSLIAPAACVQSRCRSQPSVHVGQFVRQRDRLSEHENATVAGRVLCVEECRASQSGEAEFALTQHEGRAYLITEKDRVSVQDRDMVKKGGLLGTENLLIPKTTDIVQGLPRITSLFEATKSGSGVPELLESIYEEELAKDQSAVDAAKASRDRLQTWLVAEIQSVYLSQGVNINAKHIEIIVRRMCEQCVVLDSPIPSLVPGSSISYTELERLQALNPSGDFKIMPDVRGVTRVGKNSHLIVAMGFREVDSMLTGVVQSGAPTHKLAGVKENLMLGKSIAVGTNISTAAGPSPGSSVSAWSDTVDMSRIPYVI